MTIVWASSHARAAELWTPDGDACNQKDNTLEIVDCIEVRTKVWDGRLNQAYKALTTMLRDPSMKAQIAPLKDAQKAWIKYRDANCAFYAAGQGTITQIETASCMRDMTQARAIELQSAGPQ